MPTQKFSGTLNGLYAGSGFLGAVGPASTKTITITAGAVNGILDFSIITYGPGAGNYGQLKFSAAGYLGLASRSCVVDLARVDEGDVVIGATTLGDGSITITIQNLDVTDSSQSWYMFTSSVPLTVTFA
jgi:hypothetical protein